MVNKFRNLEKTKTANNGDRTILESILYPEVVIALTDWMGLHVDKCVLIGGVALSYYVKPRTTQDVDFLFLSKNDIPVSLDGFKRTISGAFQHNRTHVEIEVVTPSTINMRIDLAESIIKTSVKKDNIFVASPSGLIVSKLGRYNRRDQADIEELILSQKIDLSDFDLTEEELEKYNIIKNSL